jgi:hypothetical protein
MYRNGNLYFAVISLGQNWDLIYLVKGSESHADSHLCPRACALLVQSCYKKTFPQNVDYNKELIRAELVFMVTAKSSVG